MVAGSGFATRFTSAPPHAVAGAFPTVWSMFGPRRRCDQPPSPVLNARTNHTPPSSERVTISMGFPHALRSGSHRRPPLRGCVEHSSDAGGRSRVRRGTERHGSSTDPADVPFVEDRTATGADDPLHLVGNSIGVRQHVDARALVFVLGSRRLAIRSVCPLRTSMGSVAVGRHRRSVSKPGTMQTRQQDSNDSSPLIAPAQRS